LAGYVTTDGGDRGVILPEGYVAVKLDSGVFEPLPHPLETSTLEKLGFTWVKAAREGRLFSVTFKICRKCGCLHEERQHRDLQAGCFAVMILGLITVAVLKFWEGSDWGLSLIAGFFMMLSAAASLGLFSWLRWRKQNAGLKLGCCSKCKATDFVTLPKAKGVALMCSHCQTENLHCTVAGIS